MNRPKRAPTATKSLPRKPESSRATHDQLSRSSRTRASTKDTVANAPKTRSAQAPTDIGDQYLKFRPAASGVEFQSMCQNRNGLPRSRISMTGHGIRATKET